jgi:DNA-binding HxlR family transcriptional regulator
MDQAMETSAALEKVALCDREESTVTFVRAMFSRLGEKWPIRALDCLADGPARFTTLMGAMPGVSHRMLTVTLRALESDGMISRTAYAEVPPRVEYELTSMGDSFLTHLLQLVGWIQDHQGEIEHSREATAD